MADEVESTPVKRGPGRPRKVVQETAVEPKVRSDPPDPRIGQFLHEGVRWVSYPDGSEYRCVDGVITERMN